MYAEIESANPRRGVCRLFGVLDHESCPQLRAALAACMEFHELYLDLSGVRFLDSAALGVLVAGIRRSHEADADVVVCGVRGHIRRLLEMTGFDRVAPVLSDPPPHSGVRAELGVAS